MPMNDQDARALTYLARRLRAETQGAGQWDEAGTYTHVSKLVGSQLAIAVERITRHAADKDARTPAAIGRPFVPDAQQPSSRPEQIPNHLRCAVCYQPQARCEAVRSADDDHEFRPATTDLRRAPDAIHAIVEEAKGRLEPMHEPPPPPVRTTGKLRDLMTTEETT